MKKIKYIICVIIFFAVCTATLTFLHKFTDRDLTVQLISWTSSELVKADGTAEEFIADNTGAPPALSEGEYLRFTGTIGEMTPDSELVFDTGSSNLRLIINGTEIYSSDSAEGTVSGAQTHIQLPETLSSSTLVLEISRLSGNIILPPIVRTVSSSETEASAIAYANNYGIASGAYGLVFVIICGLFLLGIMLKKTDLRLLILIFASAGLTVYELSLGIGYYFLDQSTLNVLSWQGFRLLIPASILIYILLNIKNGTLKLFGKITLCSAAAFVLIYLLSLARGTVMHERVNETVTALFYSDYSGILHWLTIYLVFACSAAAVFETVGSLINARVYTRTLELKNAMIINSYRAAEKSLAQTSEIRHEFKKHLAAIELMYESGNMDGIRKLLDELKSQQSELIQTQFTENFVINSLLSSAAASAAEHGIKFDAYASVPAKLDITEDDLCVFLMNLLDNAEEACMALPEGSERYIKFRAELKNGYLAISCTNPCAAKLEFAENGLPKSTKPDKVLHGLGLNQMKNIAEKYGSILDISVADGKFTLRTALCIRPQHMQNGLKARQ